MSFFTEKKHVAFKALIFVSALLSQVHAADITLLNVSYDPTREFYKEYNALFAKYYQAKTGDTVTVGSKYVPYFKTGKKLKDMINEG